MTTNSPLTLDNLGTLVDSAAATTSTTTAASANAQAIRDWSAKRKEERHIQAAHTVGGGGLLEKFLENVNTCLAACGRPDVQQLTELTKIFTDPKATTAQVISHFDVFCVDEFPPSTVVNGATVIDTDNGQFVVTLSGLVVFRCERGTLQARYAPAPTKAPPIQVGKSTSTGGTSDSKPPAKPPGTGTGGIKKPPPRADKKPLLTAGLENLEVGTCAHRPDAHVVVLRSPSGEVFVMPEWEFKFSPSGVINSVRDRYHGLIERTIKVPNRYRKPGGHADLAVKISASHITPTQTDLLGCNSLAFYESLSTHDKDACHRLLLLQDRRKTTE